MFSNLILFSLQCCPFLHYPVSHVTLFYMLPNFTCCLFPQVVPFLMLPYLAYLLSRVWTHTSSALTCCPISRIALCPFLHVCSYTTCLSRCLALYIRSDTLPALTCYPSLHCTHFYFSVLTCCPLSYIVQSHVSLILGPFISHIIQSLMTSAVTCCLLSHVVNSFIVSVLTYLALHVRSHMLSDPTCLFS